MLQSDDKISDCSEVLSLCYAYSTLMLLLSCHFHPDKLYSSFFMWWWKDNLVLFNYIRKMMILMTCCVFVPSFNYYLSQAHPRAWFYFLLHLLIYMIIKCNRKKNKMKNDNTLLIDGLSGFLSSYICNKLHVKK